MAPYCPRTSPPARRNTWWSRTEANPAGETATGTKILLTLGPQKYRGFCGVSLLSAELGQAAEDNCSFTINHFLSLRTSVHSITILLNIISSLSGHQQSSYCCGNLSRRNRCRSSRKRRRQRKHDLPSFNNYRHNCRVDEQRRLKIHLVELGICAWSLSPGRKSRGSIKQVL